AADRGVRHRPPDCPGHGQGRARAHRPGGAVRLRAELRPLADGCCSAQGVRREPRPRPVRWLRAGWADRSERGRGAAPPRARPRRGVPL
ncbi:MAG: Arsenate reductase thioredoxin-coupled, partial [uncultured Propionibacteriaceae bacterium]